MRISVDERIAVLQTDRMDKHIEEALLKLEALRDEQIAAGDLKRAGDTDADIARMESRLVYK